MQKFRAATNSSRLADSRTRRISSASSPASRSSPYSRNASRYARAARPPRPALVARRHAVQPDLVQPRGQGQLPLRLPHVGAQVLQAEIVHLLLRPAARLRLVPEEPLPQGGHLRERSPHALPGLLPSNSCSACCGVPVGAGRLGAPPGARSSHHAPPTASSSEGQQQARRWPPRAGSAGTTAPGSPGGPPAGRGSARPAATAPGRRPAPAALA